MNKRFAKASILFTILIMLSAACSLGKKASSLLGEEYKSDSGGFSIKMINGYNFDDSIGIVNMTAPESTIETGPGVMVMGGLMDQDLSNEDLLENMKAQASTIEIGKTRKIKLDGVNALSADLSGNYNDVEIKGKIIVAMFSPRQEFVMLALAPKDQWKDLEPAFEELIESVTLFEASSSTVSIEGINETMEPDVSVNTEPQLIRQWASSANAESEYSPTDWSASQATGAPNVDTCGDNGKAWASSSSSGSDSIELIYDVPVSPTEINIYQSYNPSQVVEVDIVDSNGDAWIAWSGEPEVVENCPDLMTISIELDDPLYIDRVVIYIDQSVLQTSFDEIDAVELVGYTMAGETSTATNMDPNSNTVVEETAMAVEEGQPAPTNYSGWMADSIYQGWINVIVNKTKVKDLDKIMTIQGTKSTDSWKPRPDHADTYIYKMGPTDMKAFISVTTDGIVYKKSLSPNTYPDDFKLSTVTKATYEQLDAIFQKDSVIPYSVMANILESPGLLREEYYRTEDGKIISTYDWVAPNGDRINGYFIDGLLTGMAGLSFIPAE
jgi:hypothetical protein